MRVEGKMKGSSVGVGRCTAQVGEGRPGEFSKQKTSVS